MGALPGVCGMASLLASRLSSGPHALTSGPKPCILQCHTARSARKTPASISSLGQNHNHSRLAVDEQSPSAGSAKAVQTQREPQTKQQQQQQQPKNGPTPYQQTKQRNRRHYQHQRRQRQQRKQLQIQSTVLYKKQQQQGRQQQQQQQGQQWQHWREAQEQPEQCNLCSVEIWQQQGIGSWAKQTSTSLLQRLRDLEGNTLPQRALTNMQQGLVADLGRRCDTQCDFDLRQIRAVAAEKLLQHVLDLGFSVAQTRKVVLACKFREYVDANHVNAIVSQLQHMSSSSRPKAIGILGQTPRLLQTQPTRLSETMSHIQRISGATTEQTASMVATDAQFLCCSHDDLVATLNGFLNLGYTRSQACEILARLPTLWTLNPALNVLKHAQLRDLLRAATPEVRGIVMKHPSLLLRNITGDSMADLVQLWREEIGRPLRSILKAPQILVFKRSRSAARIAFMKQRGHILSPSAVELWSPPERFCKRFSISEAHYRAWVLKWSRTPMGLYYCR